MSELFELQFFRHAFFSGVLLSLIFGLLSFFVVMRRMVFLGAGIAHSAFGGVALGVLIGMNPFVTSLFFCLITAMCIGALGRSGRISYDTSIGIFFSFTMALGAVFVALRRAYTFDLTGYLFGNILSVQRADLWMTLILFLIFLTFVLIYMQKLLFMTFDESVAQVSGVPVQWLDTLLLAFLAAIIVVSMKMVGIVLVSALVVLPASFGRLFSDHYIHVIVWSAAYTLCIMIGGLFLSYYLNLPTGAIMVVLGTAIYFTGIGIRKVIIWR